MRNNNYNFSCTYQPIHTNYSIKMTKTRTITFLIMIITACALIVSLSDAYPAVEVATESNVTTDLQSNSNNSVQPEAYSGYLTKTDGKHFSVLSRFAITHIVKTIEFQVGILEDDGNDSDNSTDATTEEYIESEIKLLNVNLLRELLDRVTEDDMETTSNNHE